uniref:Uncharacterized protein n=1 Tax=uncultured bacterium Rlip1 TaxID=581114 RepID=C0K072_9BACT|nr:hypothetical protein Xoryp_05010 [uncultured bacterium Rlip1]
MQRHSIGTQILMHLVDDLLEVGTRAVHLVDEGDARYAVFVGLVPHRLRLRLHATHGAEYRHHAVDDTQRAFHLDSEVDVTGSIDKVDLIAVPMCGDGCRSDGDAALLLLFHEVHSGLAVVGLAHLTVHAREEQDTFRNRSLSSIDMRSDTDVSQF